MNNDDARWGEGGAHSCLHQSVFGTLPLPCSNCQCKQKNEKRSRPGDEACVHVLIYWRMHLTTSDCRIRESYKVTMVTQLGNCHEYALMQ